jgi:Transposase DDE domain group 1
VKSIAAVSRVKVSADGHGVVSHAGVGMLREVAELTGLSAQVTAALSDTYRGPWVHDPGAVFADLAAAVADGADCIDGVGQACGDREHVFGPAASTTMWRPVDAPIDAAHLATIRTARAHARAAAWAAGAAPKPGEWLHLDADATITIDHSDNKEQAAATWKKTWGHHPLLVFLDRPEIAGGEALARATQAVIPPPITSPCWGADPHSFSFGAVGDHGAQSGAGRPQGVAVRFGYRYDLGRRR